MSAWPEYDARNDPLEKREADARAWREQCEARKAAGLSPIGEQAALEQMQAEGWTPDLIIAATEASENRAETDPTEIRFRALERQVQRIAQLCGINLLELET